MTTTATLRRLYTSDSVTTASPAQLVVLLYNRLVKDLNLALVTLERRDVEGSHRALRHAQEIVAELSSSLDLELWPEGRGLLALYDYVQDRLVHANVTKSGALVSEVLEVVEPLRDAFTEAHSTGEAS
ncbi:MAG: flagellar export chaperone FliS [Micrococcales bacterium]|uniref:flagellar export chaperone FliS n=1 Tax=Phycicoccus sp. TaxID=1902410 RepID=UPI0019B6F816|nr:flagellar export chaperone FliS [Phycicoccus sp.]MBD3784386.1 flagellar export chaperone FliS [Micrococcales bacterium]HMM96155.1 flagellar export chaperone FliS [Phycicoccus sp.]